MKNTIIIVSITIALLPYYRLFSCNWKELNIFLKSIRFEDFFAKFDQIIEEDINECSVRMSNLPTESGKINWNFRLDRFLISFMYCLVQVIKETNVVITEGNNETKIPYYSLYLYCEMRRQRIQICRSFFGCDNETISQGRSYLNNNIEVFGCSFFRSSMFSGDGGIIYVLGDSFSMNVSQSVFFGCISYNKGGAIYFNSLNSAMNLLCAQRCSASQYHFAYLRAKLKNHIEYLSISNCSYVTSGYYSLWLQDGEQRMGLTNFSLNNANQVAGIYVYSSKSFISSYCTISKNQAYEGICILFWYDSGKIRFNNIIDNTSPSWGVVYVRGGKPTIDYCVLLYNHDTLFCIWDGFLEISHSFIVLTGSFSTSTEVLTSSNNTFSEIETYSIDFLGSMFCTNTVHVNEQQKKGDSSIIFLISAISVISIIILLVFAMNYRMIASKLIVRHQLEDSIQSDFG